MQSDGVRRKAELTWHHNSLNFPFRCFMKLREIKKVSLDKVNLKSQVCVWIFVATQIIWKVSKPKKKTTTNENEKLKKNLLINDWSTFYVSLVVVVDFFFPSKTLKKERWKMYFHLLVFPSSSPPTSLPFPSSAASL